MSSATRSRRVLIVGSGESGVVDDLCAKDFGQPLGELGVLVSESFVVFAV